ncbi:YrhB domain-containing protein [Hamadaea tsunoensis]|uniref:YrhB domain-containing protein n=1 Tax=Hamadaea tsunoensis TaxID=53368 RepID=UPI000418CDE7|nr:YrhB domain-containing protein [Hamadaea tsunoensis]
MLSTGAALEQAERYLADTTEGDGSVRVYHEGAFRIDGELIVSWNSKALLDDGDEEAELAGNADIAVNLATGRCRYVDLDESFEFRRRSQGE